MKQREGAQDGKLPARILKKESVFEYHPRRGLEGRRGKLKKFSVLTSRFKGKREKGCAKEGDWH